MNISKRIELTYREIKNTLEDRFNIKVSANRGFFEDYRNDGKVGFSMKISTGSITSYNGNARLWNEIESTCYITVDKHHGGQLTRQQLALDIFSFFAEKGRYNNFIILDVHSFDEDFMANGVGEVFKFNMSLNLDLLEGGI